MGNKFLKVLIGTEEHKGKPCWGFNRVDGKTASEREFFFAGENSKGGALREAFEYAARKGFQGIQAY